MEQDEDHSSEILSFPLGGSCIRTAQDEEILQQQQSNQAGEAVKHHKYHCIRHLHQLSLTILPMIVLKRSQVRTNFL